MNKILIFIGLITISILSASFSEKLISNFFVQLELTEEASAYLNSIPESEKTNWLTNIPDSIPLKVSFALTMKKNAGAVFFKLGTLDGINDLYEGSFNLEGANVQGNVTHRVSGSVHYFELGNIKGLKSFTAYTWVTDSTNAVLDLARYSK